MSADLKPYPAMKDSDRQGLGKVPAHWEVSTLRRKLRPIDGIKIGPFGSQLKLEHMTPSGYKVYGQANVISRDFAHGTKFIDQTKFGELSACQVLPGDLLVTMMGTTGRCVGVPHDTAVGIMDSHLLRLRTDASVNPRFASLLIDESSYVKEQIEVAGKGSIMHGLNSGIVKALVLALPSLAEQDRIVRFLDYADRRIRRYIRAQQQLIALLEEQKQALIHQAVTGQIDVRTGRPFPAYKPSGVEWLGEVPERWQVCRSKRMFRPRRELARPNDIQLSATQAYGVISQRRYEERVGRKVVRILRHLEKRRHVEVDDFVMSMRSFQGGLERAWESGCIRSSYIVLRPATKLVVGYFGYLFKSAGYIKALRSTANFIRDGQDLNFENYCRVDLPLPAIEEQQRIAQFLEQATTAIRLAVERYRGQVDLIREYRTRLIADVVTGKFDVREAAARLPDEVEELEPLDEADALIDGEDEPTDALATAP